MAQGFEYNSGNNPHFLSVGEFLRMAAGAIDA